MSSGESKVLMQPVEGVCSDALAGTGKKKQDEDNCALDYCEESIVDQSSVACMSGISLAIPTDIALLHIETDILLDKLRESGLTPKITTDDHQQDCSPVSMKTASTDTHTTVVTAELDGDDDYHTVISVCSDDDGMRGELQHLDEATTSLQQSLLDEENEIFNWWRGLECSYSDDTFSRVLDELFVAFHDAFCYVMQSNAAKKMFQVKMVQNIIETIASRPIDTMVRIYGLIFIINLFVKIHQMIC